MQHKATKVSTEIKDLNCFELGIPQIPGYHIEIVNISFEEKYDDFIKNLITTNIDYKYVKDEE